MATRSRRSGFAIKIFDVEGPKLVEDEPDSATFDLVLKGTLEPPDWAWDEVLAFVKAATQTPVRNPLLTTYWTMAAVRHGDYVGKLRVAPAAESAAHAIHRELDLNSGPDVFGPTLVDELQVRAFDFDLQVQLCTDLDAMPVNDVTVEWPETLSPFVTVARVHLPRQDITGPRISRRVTRSRSISGVSQRITDRWVKS